MANPQSWNRYAYTFDNPLVMIDPNGLEVAGSCDAVKSVCDALAQFIADARSALIGARTDALTAGDSAAAFRINSALDNLGPLGQGNSQGQLVTINVLSSLPENSALTTSDGKNVSISFSPNVIQGGGDEASPLYGHEAAHVGQRIGDTAAGPVHSFPWYLDREYAAYRTQSDVDRYHFGTGGPQANGGWKDRPERGAYGIPLWDGGWAAADRQTKQSVGAWQAAHIDAEAEWNKDPLKR